MKTTLTLMPAILLTGFLAAGAQAAPLFTITSTLTGDIRLDSPDNLIVDVTIVVDDSTPNQAAWTVDINSPLHPNVKLDEFYFNLTGSSSDYSFSGFNPTGWNIVSPADVQGAGGATFMFEALDPAGPPNAADVTNSQNLTFIMTSAAALTQAIFLDAPTALSNDAGSGQLGAHLQSLTTAGNCGASTNCSDSGFAFGNYAGGTEPPLQIPEPGMLFLMGAGLLGLGMARRRTTA
jgi:hypothetical protein